MTITLTDILRYPVKGLNAESLSKVRLTAGCCLPNDRRFALAHGSTRFDALQPSYLPPSRFVALKTEERLALLEAEFDDETGVLTLRRRNKQVARAKITEPIGRTLIDQFFAGFLGPSGRGMSHLVTAPGHHFTDSSEPVLSILNLASVADLKRVARRDIDPRRFRANLWLEGAPAWSEMAWIGQEITFGALRLQVVEAIDRCAATNVDPDTAQRDINLPQILQRGYGHIKMGLYAEVLDDGEIAVGDSLTVPGAGD
jgi:uncharacterized protein YcbX